MAKCLGNACAASGCRRLPRSRAAAAAAADDGASSFTMLPAWTLGDKVLGDRHDEGDAPSSDGSDDDDAGLDAVAMRVGELAQLVFAKAAQPAGRRTCHAANPRLLDGADGRPAGCARLRP